MEFLSWCRLQWDRVTAVVALAAGALLLLAGWVKVSGTPYAAEQIPLVVSCGLGGIFLLGVGAMLWHSADLRDQWRKLDRLEERFETMIAAAGPRPPAGGARGVAIGHAAAGVDLGHGPGDVEPDRVGGVERGDGAVMARPGR